MDHTNGTSHPSLRPPREGTRVRAVYDLWVKNDGRIYFLDAKRAYVNGAPGRIRVDQAGMEVTRILKRFGHKLGDPGTCTPWQLGPRLSSTPTVLVPHPLSPPRGLPDPCPTDEILDMRVNIDALARKIALLQQELARVQAEHDREIEIERLRSWARGLVRGVGDNNVLLAVHREILLTLEERIRNT